VGRCRYLHTEQEYKNASELQKFNAKRNKAVPQSRQDAIGKMQNDIRPITPVGKGPKALTIESPPFSIELTINTTCAICIEDFDPKAPDTHSLGCKHKFRKNCLKDWLAFKPECPLCRAVVF